MTKSRAKHRLSVLAKYWIFTAMVWIVFLALLPEALGNPVYLVCLVGAFLIQGIIPLVSLSSLRQSNSQEVDGFKSPRVLLGAPNK
jgi:hypothetical protein